MMTTALTFIGALMATLVIFALADRWHRRYAWRKAHEETVREWRRRGLHVPGGEKPALPRSCRHCGCTDDDCSGCIELTGAPCFWVKFDLCSACAAIESTLADAEH